MLLETAAPGAVARLELATPAGLLTLHPERDQSMLHGNVVRPTGIEHLALPWPPGAVLLVGASPVTAAVTAADLSGRVEVGEGTSVAAIEVGDDLAVRRATWRVARVGDRRWRLLAADGGAAVAVTLDADGVPDLEDGRGWPLEEDPGPR